MPQPNHTLHIANHRISLRIPESVDPYLDELANRPAHDFAVADEQLPYWAELWPSAWALAQFILQERPFPTGARVLELGSGVGLGGISAGLLGADVVMTDLHNKALNLSAENWRFNLDLPPHTAMMDWRAPDPSQTADWIIASDILYETRWLEPVHQTLLTCLKPFGTAFIAEPRRNVARPFFETMIPAGPWRHTIHQVEPVSPASKTLIDIHCLKRQDGS